jgi:uncharacterized linocin/CFP29 family protein
MSDKYLDRDDAPFSEKLWEVIDAAVIGAAKSRLSGRRLLHIAGPFGLGLKALPGGDREVEDEGLVDGVRLVAGCGPLVAGIEATFTLPMRDVAAFEEHGLPPDLSSAGMAAMACAQQEDTLIFEGSKALGAPGLLTADGADSLKLQSWNELGKAADDVIKAVTRLDGSGFHGPYALALTPDRYNLLLRRYRQGNMTELQHIASIVTDGVVKAPAIASGGVLLASGREFASIALGQDLKTGFIGPDGRDFEFSISESLALRLLQPAAVCVLR